MTLLITGAWKAANHDIACIENMGHKIIVMKNESGPMPVPYDIVDGVICNGLFLYHPIEKFVNLRYIQTTSAGLDRIPIEYINSHSVQCFNARGVYSIPMAEFAVCGVLQLYKESRYFYENQKKHLWCKNRDLHELNGAKVCIIGCGSVGIECAKRFGAFGCRTVGVDILPYDNVLFEHMSEMEKLEEEIRDSDIVILTLPLTNQTTHLFDAHKLSLMKGGSILVNIARGAIVDTNDLIDALQNRLFGAVLDVFEDEPLKDDSPLWDADNVILTPHNSFAGEKNDERLFQVIINNLQGEKTV